MKLKASLCGSIAVAALTAGTAFADGKVTVITSFPESMTGPIEKAFEAANPGYDLEVLNKSTSSGVKFLEETAGSNTSDIFWASAPDAFEVLKAEGLLAKIAPKSDGIPEKIGA